VRSDCDHDCNDEHGGGCDARTSISSAMWIVVASSDSAGELTISSSFEIPQNYCFWALLASARSLIRGSWCFHNRSNVLVHSCNGRIAIAFTL
jgi:hypothetical protein